MCLWRKPSQMYSVRPYFIFASISKSAPPPPPLSHINYYTPTPTSLTSPGWNQLIHAQSQISIIWEPIESWMIIEYQAHDSAPLPSPSPLSRRQVVSLSQSSYVSPVVLTDRRRGGGWARSRVILWREAFLFSISCRGWILFDSSTISTLNTHTDTQLEYK